MDHRHAPWLAIYLVFASGSLIRAQVAPMGREAAGLAAEQAGQLPQALDAYVAALQTLPNPPPLDADRRLREHIIKVALRLDPPATVPDEATQKLTRAQTAAKTAQNPRDLEGVISEFQGALRLAPWLPSAYFALGESQEKLRDYPAAIRSFEFYLLAAPTAQDAESVQKRIADLHGRFPAVCLQHTAWWVHMDPTWSFGSGELTLSNGSIKLNCPDGTFNVQISEVRSLERKIAPAGLLYLRIVPQHGKKFDFSPAGSGDDAVAGVEKAIRDMASQHGIVLK